MAFIRNLAWLIILLLSACARINCPQSGEIENQEPQISRDASGEIASHAQKALGSRYKSGGEKPGAFDCSGLVQWAAEKSGIKLPRTAREQIMNGLSVLSSDELKPGDILAFKPKRGYHVGIYMGDGKFIHSSSRYNRVKYSSLDNPYFRKIYMGARRIANDSDIF